MEHYSELAGAPKSVGPYSIATRINSTLYLSGQIGIDPATMKIVDGGIEAQARQVMENLKAVLTACGSSFERVGMTTIFLTDITHGKVVNEIYGSFFTPGRLPARQTIAVKDLPLGAVIEISMIAE
jgi:2-iminobutanoate/2-iminopropanoate deaminase